MRRSNSEYITKKKKIPIIYENEDFDEAVKRINREHRENLPRNRKKIPIIRADEDFDEAVKRINREHIENSPKNKIIGYIRSSTTEEKEYSFSPSSEVQKHLIKEKCLSKNVTLDKIYEDDSDDGNQPQLQLLLQEIRLGDTLIVYSINRLNKNDQLCISNIF